MIAFSIYAGLIFAVLDIYVAAHWIRHVRRNGMSRWFSYAVWIITLAMWGVYWYVVSRRHFFRMDGFDVFLFSLVCFWSLPKILIVPVLLLRDVFAGLRALVRFGIAQFRTLQYSGGKGAPPAHEPALAAAGATPAVEKPDRRRFIANAGWSVASVPYVIVGNGLWRTLYDFRVIETTVVLPGLPRALDGLRLAQISDIHAGSFPDHKPFQEARRMLDATKPDILTITGDFVNATPGELATIFREMEKLSAPMGVFASLGNHDHYNTEAQHAELNKLIRQSGIDLLVNEHRRIKVGNEGLVIAGTDNTGFKQHFAKLNRALDGVEGGEAVVLLAHDPTFWDKEVVGKHDIGLMLSGHTHGGQFGVEFMGMEWSPAKHVYKQWAGLYKTGDQQLYVNRGLGTVGPPIRIGIRPEITVITLKAPPAGGNAA